MNEQEALQFVGESIFKATNKTLTDLQTAIIKKTLEGATYQVMADELKHDHSYVKDVGSNLWKELTAILEISVSKGSFRTAIEKKYQELQCKRDKSAPSNSTDRSNFENNTRHDWGEVYDAGIFYGRDKELADLNQWIVDDKCRVVMLLGMGGIGKTTLSVELARQIQSNFQHIIWRGVDKSFSVDDVIDDWLKFISNQNIVEFPSSTNDKIRQLIQLLRTSRCLLILDNFESALVSGDCQDSYLEGYEKYGDLIERIGKTNHQSCLLLTSRTMPSQIAKLEGKKQPVRTLPIDGLNFENAQQILHENDLKGSIEEKTRIAEIYSSNPLALRLISNYIDEYFNGNMTEFLSQSAPIFGEIRQILDEQFVQLPELERSIMYWLAINREPVLIAELLEDIIPQPTKPAFQEALEHLKRRSLVQRNDKGFSLQNVILEYVTQNFIEKVIEEITTGQLDLFHSHALIKATASEYIREAQTRLILKPIADLLTKNLTDIEANLIEAVQIARNDPQLKSGYVTGNVLNLLCYLKQELSGYDFSRLTIRQAYLRGKILHGVDLSHTELIQSVFTQDFGIVFSVASSPDGQYLATGHSSGMISIWEVATGKELSNCIGHTGRVYAVAFSPDSKMLASGSDDKTVRLWDVPSGEFKKIFKGHTNSVGTVSFSPSGMMLASGSEDNTIRLWDVPDGACRKIFKGHNNHVWSVAFSPTGEILASGSFDSSIKLWNLTSGSCMDTLIGHNDAVASVAFNPTGEILASGSHDKTVMLWDINNGSCTKVFSGHSDRIWSVAFDLDGKTLASGSYDKTIRLWNIDQSTCIDTLIGHTNWVRSVAFVGEGKTLASGSYDSTIRVWDTSKGDCLHILNGYYVSICATAMNPNGEMLASGSADSLIRLWNVPDRSYSNTLPGHSGWVYALTFSPDGRMLASGSSDKTVKLWNFEDGVCSNTLPGHSGWVYAVAFSPDGQMLASGSQDRTIRLWSTDSGACSAILQEHSSTVGAIAFSPNGKLLASGSQDRTIRLWDIRKGNYSEVLRGHTDQIWSIAFSPDGQMLASCSFDKTVRLWDVKSGKCLKILQGHSGFLLSVAFSPDGKMLASAGYDQTVRLWDVKSGGCISTLQGHTNWVRSVNFTDSDTLFSGSQDETIKLWDVKTGDCLETLEAPKPYENTNITGILGLTEPEINTLKFLGADNLS